VTVLTDADLYGRGAATLVASWDEYAREATAAELVRAAGVAVAVFPCEPERSVYNNALLERDLDALERAAAVEAMEAAYGLAGVSRFAAWVHESDGAMRGHLERRGYTIGESSRAMGMSLDEICLARPALDVGPVDWSEHVRVGELPPGLLSAGDHTAFHVLVARLGGENVATALAFHHGNDCGIYNVGTLPHARRRGLGTGLTLALLYDSVDRGCRTASLQSTPMAERVYTGVGFRDLGRILEYMP
jgi:ribosomal protein S18 acetylase RimI-like enzyme